MLKRQVAVARRDEFWFKLRAMAVHDMLLVAKSEVSPYARQHLWHERKRTGHDYKLVTGYEVFYVIRLA